MNKKYRYGLRRKWRDIIESIEEISMLYTKVNKIISLGLSDKLRIKGVEKIDFEGNFLDAGCGPGDLTKIIRKIHPKSYIVGLDTSYYLTKVGLDILSEEDNGYIDLVNGLFEKPPFRAGSFHGIFSAYALRDSIHLVKAIRELSKVIRRRGFIIDIDIGNPISSIVRYSLILYMKTAVPILSSFYSKKLDSPWKKLVDTICRIPRNNILEYIFKGFFRYTHIDEYALGTMIIVSAYDKK